MLNATAAFHARIAENSKTLFKATLRFADGSSVELGGSDVMMGSASFSQSVSSNGSFDIGSAIIGQFKLTLNNYDGRFDARDFTGSTIVPSIGVELSNGAVEWLGKGAFAVEQPKSYGSTIGLTALDNMSMFERPYSDVGTLYPATIQKIVRDICSTCGVTLKDDGFANGSYVVGKRPEETLTCLQMISMCAQVTGNYARCDVSGRLLFEWYDTEAFDSEDWLDGERFDDASPYASGSRADGGSFTDYSSGSQVDGGEFSTDSYARLYAFQSLAVATDDVIITGVRVVAEDGEDSEGAAVEGESSLYGTQGYVLAIEGNPLVEYGKAATVAAQVGARVVGMRFRPFEASAVGDPTVEPGDPAILIDRLQNQYRSYITSATYSVGGYEKFACSAETPSRNSASTTSVAATIADVKKAVRRERSAREAALETLGNELAQSSGMFITEERQDDGSSIYYLHDKPTLSESKVVWKLTANAFGISSDGGETYIYGLDANGDAILNRLYAIGLNADYLTAGALSVESDEVEVFRADVETGTVMVNTENFKVTPEGVITATSGMIGGFTIGQSALYNGLSELNGSENGVYLGTDGIATSNGSVSLKLADGGLEGRQNGAFAGSIYPTLTLRNAVTQEVIARGVAIEGGAVSLYTDYVVVKDPDNIGMVLTCEDYTPQEWGVHADLTNWIQDEDPYELTPASYNVKYVHGLAVFNSVFQDGFSPRRFYSAGQVDSKLSRKANSTHTHAISDVTNLQTTLDGKASSSHSHSNYALTTHTHSEYASSYHTHAYSEITGKPSIPTFSLSGTTLTITT